LIDLLARIKNFSLTSSCKTKISKMSADPKSRLNALVDLANRTLASRQTDSGTVPRHRVSAELFAELRSGGLSFIHKSFGEKHPFYSEFDNNVRFASPKDTERALGILKALKAELES
jgi:hypothetical protein